MSSRELEEALQFLHGVVASDLDGVAACDGELRIVHWSPTLERLTGLAAAELLGAPALRAVPELAEHGGESLLRDALAGRCRVSLEPLFPLVGSPSAAALESYFSPLHGSDGAIVGAAVVVRDRRERKRIDQQIRETEQRFRTMADCAPVLLWMSETDSLCSFFNQTWLDFSGRPFEEERGVGWAEGVHPEDFQTCMDTYVDAFNAREDFEMVYRLQRHDGQYRWILDRGTPRYTPDGEFAGYIGSCIDITDRVDTEDALRVMADSLTRANADLEQFVRIAAHDLRAPLRAIDHLSQWIETGVADSASDDVLRQLGRLRARVRRMDRLVEAVRQYASAGRESLEVEIVEVEELVAEVFDLLGEPEEFEISVDAQIPPITTARIPLQQVLFNLLTNAVKHHDRAGGRLAVSARDRDRFYEFEVRDDGPGIPPQLHEKALQMFQILRPRDESSDTGIGLALVKRLVEDCGGRIELESPVADDRGLCVRFTWPREWKGQGR